MEGEDLKRIGREECPTVEHIQEPCADNLADSDPEDAVDDWLQGKALARGLARREPNANKKHRRRPQGHTTR